MTIKSDTVYRAINRFTKSKRNKKEGKYKTIKDNTFEYRAISRFAEILLM